MNLPVTWKIALGAVIALAIAVVGYEWLGEHDARLEAESAQQQKDALIASLQQQKAANDQRLAVTLNQLEAARKVPATPQQIVIDAQKLVPNLPQPIQLAPPPAPVPGAPLPDSPQPQGVLIPPADLQSIRDFGITCQENAAKLSACQKDAGLASQQYQAMSQERDQWKAAAKGGTLWHRTISAAKWIAIGGGVGYVAAHKWR